MISYGHLDKNDIQSLDSTSDSISVSYPYNIKDDGIQTIKLSPSNSKDNVSGKFTIDVYIDKNGEIFNNNLIQLTISESGSEMFNYRNEKKINDIFDISVSIYKPYLDSILAYVKSLQVVKINDTVHEHPQSRVRITRFIN